MPKDAPPNGGAPTDDGPIGPRRRVSEMQAKLHRWAAADPGRRFDDLFNFVHDPATLIVAFERVAGNTGSRTPGVDGLTVADVEEVIGVPGFLDDLHASLKAGTFAPLPVRERKIPKPGGSGKVRSLGIPTVADRVVQAALKLVLEPIFEADFVPVSYGFRPMRRAHDAIAEIHHFGTSGYRWVLDADIEACFDSIDHTALMDRVRRRVKDKRVLMLVKAFLKAGILTELGENRETHTGTPQGGILSPLLANIALSVLDEHLHGSWQASGSMATPSSRARRRRKDLPNWRVVRYADDFVITGRSKALLEEEVKPLVEQFLQERGLELSPTKTVITHVENGFDFLGQNVRRYPNGKLLIKPSSKNVKIFLDRIRQTVKAALGMSAADLIDALNPMIRGWANYHRHVVSKRTFARVDHAIFSSLWQWARRRHPNKNLRWLKAKYFARRGNRDWSFFGETCDDEGQLNEVWLYYANSTPIQRHVKVKGEANPYDPAYETYFEDREGAHMLDTFRGTRTLRYLWHEQTGLCPVCKTKLTRITGWRLHYCVPRSLGGSRSADNRVLLHPECHDRVHRQHLSISKPRLPERGVRSA